MARTTDIYCTVCNAKSVIERAERIHSEFTRYYCACKNPQCGHRFVMNMEFGHTTRSSKLTKDKLLELVLGKLSDDEKAKLKGNINSDRNIKPSNNLQVIEYGDNTTLVRKHCLAIGLNSISLRASKG